MDFCKGDKDVAACLEHHFYICGWLFGPKIENWAYINGHTRWTGFSEYPNIVLLGYDRSHIFTAIANIDHAKEDLVPNLRSNGTHP